ncbi:MAG: ATP-binding protein [Arcobacter sp.]|nr:ATP-binding protein [Arcobacter sp.]
MLKRKLYKKLKEWKENSQGKTAILIDGARRVGKSWLCEEFAKNEYKSYIIIDFGNVPKEIKDIFENDSTNFELFFAKLSAFYSTKLYKRDSLIVFDEVQMYPKARGLIKYLVKDGRFDYIQTGSLLSLKMNVKDIIIPSEERHLQLYPLDFEEFLWALEDEVTVSLIRQSFESLSPLGALLHRKILNQFRQYILVGGMPQVVLEYIKSKDFQKTDEIKRDILSLYRKDVAKFARGYENKVISIFDQIPSQLSKKEKRYKLSSLGKNARLREYENAFLWLEDAMITNTCFNANEPSVALALSSDFNTRKCYMADTGLLISQSFLHSDITQNELYKALLFDKLHINEGMFTENVVASMLRVNGHRLFFYSRCDSKNRANHLEIDFLIVKDNKICPIEVKSSVYKKHSSLDKFNTKFAHHKLGKSYILYQKDLQIKDGILHLPIYMAICL